MTSCVSATSTTLSPNIYVSPTGDDTNDGLTPSTAVQTISTGIDKVAQKGTVNLAAGIYNKTGATGRDVGITITKNLTIAGAGKEITIIDGLNASQIFDISYDPDATVLIKDITFQNGKLENSGGAISSDGTLTVQNCVFKDNTAVDDGGGAIFTHTTLNVVNCIFTGNVADAGGAIFNKGGSITVTGSTFIANHAGTNLEKYSGGGAIFNYYDSSFKIVGNTFLNNAGGAIHIASQEKSETEEELQALINFNRIAGNTQYGIYLENAQDLKETATSESQTQDKVVDATNNWWGSNSNPKNNPANIGGDIDHVLADPWLILTISASPGSVPFGSKALVTARITQNSNGQDTSSMGHIPDGTPITITTDIGNVGSKSVVKYTVNGIATATLRADDGFGTANLFAILDGFKTPVPSQVEITPAAAGKSNTVNAASKTIPLQKTGLPLAGLVLAILAVFGGLATSKKF